MNNNQDFPTEPTKSKHGGARPGAGRPVGSKNKLSGQSILDALEAELGHNYAKRLALNYVDTMMAGDTDRLLQYDRLILNKVVADKVDIGVGESQEALEAKQRAFEEVLQQWMEKQGEDK